MAQVPMPVITDSDSLERIREYWEIRFKAHRLPTNEELHRFLDGVMFGSGSDDVQNIDWSANKPIPSICTDFKYRVYADDVLSTIIRKLGEQLEHNEICDMLNMTRDDGISLVSKAAQRFLVGGLEALMQHGALIGGDTTAMSVFRTIFCSGCPDIADNTFKRNYLRERDQIRKLLDRTMCTTLRDTAIHEDQCVTFRYYIADAEDPELRKVSELSVGSLRNGMYEWHDQGGLKTHSMWVHVPATNGLIVEAVVESISKDLIPWFLTTLKSSTVAPGDPYLTYREAGYWPTQDRHDTQPDTIIVFPCLELKTLSDHNADRRKYENFRNKLTTTAWDFASECTVHFERTLDEAYFPGLGAEQLKDRNIDQKVSSSFRASPSPDDDDAPIIIVPQLWIWKCGDVVITARRTWQHNYMENIPCVDNAAVTMGYVVANSIKEFGEERYVPPHDTVPPILDLFEGRVVSVLSEVKEYMQSAKRNILDFDTEVRFHHDLSDCRSELAMVQYFLAQQDEILSALLKEHNQVKDTTPTKQQEIGSGTSNAGTPAEDEDTADAKPYQPSQADWAPVEEAYIMLKRYQERVRKIDGDAERIEKTVQDLLNLKRTYASVQDSHASVLLSAAAIGFAVVTIVFAPLAFLTALFALNLQGFDKLRVKQTSEVAPDGASSDSGGEAASAQDQVFDSGKIAGIFVGTEVLTVVVTGLVIWASLRWFGIEVNDLKPRKEKKIEPAPKEEEVNEEESVAEEEDDRIKRYMGKLKRRRCTSETRSRV